MNSRSLYFLLTVLGLGLLSGFLYWKTTYHLGLDVKGGVRFTYEVQPVQLPGVKPAPLEEVIAKTQTVLENRIQSVTGVSEGTVVVKGGNQLVVEIPGYADADKAREQIGTSASLKGYWARNVRTEVATFRRFSEAGDSAADQSSNPSVSFLDNVTQKVIKPGDPEYAAMINGGTELTFSVTPAAGQDAKAAVGSAQSAITTVLHNLNKATTAFAEVRDNTVVVYVPTDLDQIAVQSAIITGVPTAKYVSAGVPVLANDAWYLIFSGQDLSSAGAEAVGNGEYQPRITLTSEGGDKMEKWSSAHRDQRERIACVLDGTVIQVAGVRNGQVLGKEFVVSSGSAAGGFSSDYVKGLTGLLNAGALPADLKLLSSEKVDPTIGANALNKMIFAGAIAFAVISLFLIVYYALPGFVALIALMLYVLFTLTVLKLMGATFSLAAIAGFVLSVGMAVDANILVFERFKEEIKKGKPLHNALQLGFSRALPAIIDSNSCSILTSLVLASIGTGPVRGFATTLIIGVVISLFTAVTVTRSLLFFCTDSFAGEKPQWYGLNRNWFGEHLESEANTKPLQIVNNARKWFTITAIVIVSGLACIFMHGLKPGVDLTGGYEAVYERTAGFPSAPDITANLAKAGIQGANVKFGTSEDNKSKVDLAYITVPGTQLKDKSESEQAAFLTQSAGIPTGVTPKSTETVGPEIQKETVQNAIVGILASFVLIIIYLGFRFGLALGSFTNGLRFGISAIVAGAKDILVILGVAAAFGLIKHWELSALFITAMLTVIGFSVHDKIVIFDRVRENLRHPLTGETFENLMNRSVTQSFARSINTAAAVCVMLLILIIFGTTTPELSFFCVTMLSGIAWGTYSSIYTAAPVLNIWEQWIAKNKGEQFTLLAGSLAEINKHRTIRSVVVPAPATATATPGAEAPAPAQRSYGQVKRRASAVQRSRHDLDD